MISTVITVEACEDWWRFGLGAALARWLLMNPPTALLGLAAAVLAPTIPYYFSVAYGPVSFSAFSYLFTSASLAVCYHYSALCSSLSVTL